MRTEVVISLIAASVVLSVRGSAQSTVPWSSLDMGFAVSSSSTTAVTSVVGQGFVGRMQGGNIILQAGFLVDTLLRTPVTTVADPMGLPKEYALRQNYPNPFNPSTTIRVELPHASRISLKVYNTLGQEVTTLVDQEKSAGVYDVRFDAGGFAGGMYIYRLLAGDFVSTKKMVFVK